MTLDARVDERTLRELYLAPFEAIVREARRLVGDGRRTTASTASSMTESPLLARRPARASAGFDGVVDVRLVRDPLDRGVAPRAALDLVMPGPDGPWGDALWSRGARRRGRRGDDRRQGPADPAPGRSRRRAGRDRAGSGSADLRRRRGRRDAAPGRRPPASCSRATSAACSRSTRARCGGSR